MKVAKISRKLIKPHTPTPQNLKNYNISFVDQHVGTMNIAVVLFYQSKPQHEIQLQESLSKILVQFYPLAGRFIKNHHFVDCSDQGAEFVEAEALEIEFIDLVANIDTYQLNDLVPDQYFRVDEASHDPLLSIQATHFSSGGLAIAISVSHRVFDGSSLGTFVAAWSNSTNPDSYKTVGLTITPSFDLPSLLPSKDHDFGVSSNQFSAEDDMIVVVKRLLFDKVALTSLKSKIIRSNDGKTASTVRVVCAVIAKALIRLDRAKHGINRDFIILQPVNMRGRTIPPQPNHACGNFFIPSLTRCVAATEAEEIDMAELVDIMGEGVKKCIVDHAEILSPNRDGRDIVINTFENLSKEMWNGETNVIVFGDWSKFGFYEADFGWGKPVWTSIGPQQPRISSTVLMSNKEGDGIEAWLHLNQSDMRCFEQDEEIKLYAA